MFHALLQSATFHVTQVGNLGDQQLVLYASHLLLHQCIPLGHLDGVYSEAGRALLSSAPRGNDSLPDGSEVFPSQQGTGQQRYSALPG